MTQPQHSGRLELTWTNKHRRLLAHDDACYEWVDPADYRVSEVRLLRDAQSVGGVHSDRQRAKDNLLIRGDALHALTSLVSLPELAEEYAGKVKLAYIDPPFNTGQTFQQYDDGLEHSVWLTMMRDRLVQIRDLLSADGSVWVHLDDNEAAYARVLLDELFGRDCFVATVIWEKADSPRNSARQFSTDHDYILVYAKDAGWRPNRLPRTSDSDKIYTNPDDDPRGPWLPSDPFANKPYSKGLYSITGPTGRVFRPPKGRFWRISKEKFEELDADGRIWWGTNGDARPSIKRFLSEVQDLVPRTLWRHEEVGSNRTSKNEIRRLFPDLPAFDTPKPEALMERIVTIATDKGDIVLDCFAGSGTTAAVAHKMGRRWVTIEWSEDTLRDFLIPRLTKVVKGEDSGGITEAVDWEGGGGFRILDVAPSMFQEVDGRVLLADWATDSALAEATAAQLRFEYELESPFCGRKGRQRLAVLDGIATAEILDLLVGALGEGEKLLLCATAVAPAAHEHLKQISPGSRIRKIPASILAEYRLAYRTRRQRELNIETTEADSSLEQTADTTATS